MTDEQTPELERCKDNPPYNARPMRMLRHHIESDCLATRRGVLREIEDLFAVELNKRDERISELVRENAELKQVPRHIDDSPRCPLRDSMTGEMGECQPDCMWLICDMDMGVPYHTGHCAISVIARELMGEKPMGMRFVPIYEESEE